ncbi:MAG: carbohydrate kinase family protein [Candidatus Sulfotelmatobacter sp.]|jgi:sugar/nucleoside kinase (ribokinase family)
MSESLHFVVAGHLCVDLTPPLASGWPQPGGLAEAGDLQFSCGGAVGNVGSALSRLGCSVRLIGLVGDDRLGEIAIQLMQPFGAESRIRIAPGQATSYSIVIAPEGYDRAFLHCPGANAVFSSADVRDEDLKGAGWLHFGYPPVMPAIAADGGRELADLFHRARQRGLRTSLDFCSISGTAAATDWQNVLCNCARAVTVFTPSIEELRAALRQPPRDAGDIDDVRSLARTLFAMGFSILAIKLGTSGLYLATRENGGDLSGWQFGPEWRARELMAPCFRAHVVNATGAGDCAIAGLIASIACGSGPEQALTMAAATGACSVETWDASSGVRPMVELKARIESGWERTESMAPGKDWIYDARVGVWNHV